MRSGGSRLRLAVVLDAYLEGWTSMDYVGEMLVSTLRDEHSSEVAVSALQPWSPRILGRLPGPAHWARISFDRLVTRCVVYPASISLERTQFDVFHIADHSYSHVGHVLPPRRTGIYCHDLDAVRPLLDGAKQTPYQKALALSILRALRRAAVVFFSTEHVRGQISHYGLVDSERLIHAPYGIAREFCPSGPVDKKMEALLPQGRFLLHVGSAAPRKRLDLLFRTFAALRKAEPEMVLVQQGAELTSAHHALIASLGIGSAIVRLPRLPRESLAYLYRRASAVVLPSESEGFGLPLLEALACGRPVLSSDISAYREVGGNAVSYCGSSDPSEWAERLLALMREESSGRRLGPRLAQASLFSWSGHANSVLAAYRALS
jgi:glycosyltransferase involved in cell wall biosynthesis